MKRIIEYLKTTKDIKLVIENECELILGVFADTNWAKVTLSTENRQLETYLN